MSPGIRLIVGLGNPGADYEPTRHNAGAWFVLAIAQSLQVTLRYEATLQGFHGIVKIGQYDCHLLIPTTFMNLSGRSVNALARYYKISCDSILIAHDEIDIPVGDIRLKWDGGHGGHNGLRDIIEHLNTKQFYRLRIGIGRPSHSKDVEHYVLKPPSKQERETIDTVLEKAKNSLPLMLEGKLSQAMQTLHSKDP